MTQHQPPLYRGKDRQLVGEVAAWIDPRQPLAKDLLFFASDPKSHRGSALGWGIVAGLALLAIPGMLYLGETGFVGGLLALALISGSWSMVAHLRARRATSRRAAQRAQGTWRCGRFWSSQHYLVRHSANFCFLVPRDAVTDVFLAEDNIAINERNQYRSISLNINYRLENGKEVGFRDFEQQASLRLPKDIEALRQSMNLQRELIQNWVTEGDLAAIQTAEAARQSCNLKDT